MVAPFWCCCEREQRPPCVLRPIGCTTVTEPFTKFFCVSERATMAVERMSLTVGIVNQLAFGFDFPRDASGNTFLGPYELTVTSSGLPIQLTPFELRDGVLAHRSTSPITLSLTIRGRDVSTGQLTGRSASWSGTADIEGRVILSAPKLKFVQITPEPPLWVEASLNQIIERMWCIFSSREPGDVVEGRAGVSFRIVTQDYTTTDELVRTRVTGNWNGRGNAVDNVVFPVNVDLEVSLDLGACCRAPFGCIASGIAKSEDGWCCPLSQFETITLRVLDAPTACGDCFDIQGVEDGRYTTLPTISGRHYLDKVGSPPVGVDHQWQVKVSGVVEWSDATSFDGSCTSLTARSAGDLVYQVSQTGTIWTVEILFDITDAGPGAPFTDTVFRHVFTHPSDCAGDFGRVVGSELTTSNWDCTGAEVPNADLDVGWGGRVEIGFV